MLGIQEKPIIATRSRESRAIQEATAVTLTTFKIMAFSCSVPFLSFGKGIGLVPLPLGYFPWLVGTLLSYCVLTQVVKTWYIRRFKMWL